MEAKSQKFIKLLGMLAILSYPSFLCAAEEVDQLCNAATNRSQLIGGGGHVIYQTFKPQRDYISAASVLLKTDGVGEIKLSILSSDGRESLGSATAKEIQSNKEEYYFTFLPIKVTKGSEYLLIAEPTRIGNEGISWYYVQNDNGSCYADGNIISNYQDLKTDMIFATYGYNEGSAPASSGNTENGIGQATDVNSPIHAPILNDKKQTAEEAKVDTEVNSADVANGLENADISTFAGTVKSMITNGTSKRSVLRYLIPCLIVLSGVLVFLLAKKRKRKYT